MVFRKRFFVLLIFSILAFQFFEKEYVSIYRSPANRSLTCSDLVKAFFRNNPHYQVETAESYFRYGPMLKYKAGNETRNPDDVKELKIMSYNLLNLEHHAGKFERGADGQQVQVKPIRMKDPIHQENSAKAIKEEGPDIILGQEIENLEAMDHYIKNYLPGYIPFFIKGNDQRIHNAFFFKKDLPFKVEVHSFRDWKDSYTGSEREIFSRDLPILLIWKRDAANNDPPIMAIGNVHLKSKRSTPNDPESNMLRTVQATNIKKVRDFINQHFKQKTGHNIDIVFGGDFNTDVPTAQELEILRQNDFFDALDISQIPFEGSRVTHTYHPHDGPTSKSQLDAILVNKEIKDSSRIKKAHIHRYKDENGNVKPIPENKNQRKQNPSDHFPIITTIKLQ